MGRKLDALLGKRFKSTKCRTLLRLAVSRIKILKNKKEISAGKTRKEVAECLKNGDNSSALSKVEQVIREKNVVAAYALLERFCEVVIGNMVNIEKQKTCPLAMQESIASLVFAAPKCGDLPELMDICSLFALKYGKEFISSAQSLHPHSKVNNQIVEKLLTNAPSLELKLSVLQEIASEYGISWKREVKGKLLKPSEDPERSCFSCSDVPLAKHTLSDTHDLDKQSEACGEKSEIENMGNAKDEKYCPGKIESGSNGFEIPKFTHRIHGSSNRPQNSNDLQMGMDVNFTDPVTAAQAAFVSASYAAAAARAAAHLSKNESRMKALGLTEEETGTIKVNRDFIAGSISTSQSFKKGIGLKPQVTEMQAPDQFFISKAGTLQTDNTYHHNYSHGNALVRNEKLYSVEDCMEKAESRAETSPSGGTPTSKEDSSYEVNQPLFENHSNDGSGSDFEVHSGGTLENNSSEIKWKDTHVMRPSENSCLETTKGSRVFQKAPKSAAEENEILANEEVDATEINWTGKPKHSSQDSKPNGSFKPILNERNESNQNIPSDNQQLCLKPSKEYGFEKRNKSISKDALPESASHSDSDEAPLKRMTRGISRQSPHIDMGKSVRTWRANKLNTDSKKHT